MTITVEDVQLSDEVMSARLSKVKGKAASRAQLVSYKRWSNVPGPIELWTRWSHARHSHSRFFALQGEGLVPSNRAMSRCLQNCLSEIGVTAPAGGKYTSHSLRIGSHTEQVLMGFPLEARLARFGWGPSSAEMANLYFDRTLQVSAASFWLFGPPPLRYSSASPFPPPTS